MTPPKKWPHQAEYARLDTISRSRQIRELTKQCRNRINEPSIIRNLGDILDLTYEIEIGMLNVGIQAEKASRLQIPMQLNGEAPVTSRDFNRPKL
jgi:hypothetical protein